MLIYVFFLYSRKTSLWDDEKVYVIFQFSQEYYLLIINFLDDANLVYQRAIFIDG